MTAYRDDAQTPVPTGPPRMGFRWPEEPPDGRPVIFQRPFWTYADEQELYEHAVRTNPKRKDEGAGTYIARIASIVAGRRLPPAVQSMPKARMSKAEVQRRVAELEGQREPGMEG